MKQAIVGVVVVLAGVAAETSTAQAYLFTGTSGDDTIVVGMIKRSGDTLPVAYGCVDDGSTGHWYTLGDSSGLTAGGEVEGEGGDDDMFIVPSKGVTGPTHCQVSGQSWGELLYDGYWIDLLGGEGNDQLSDGGGAHDTYVEGELGSDTLFEESTIGQAIGGPGNDKLFGYAPGSYEILAGQQDTDCIYVSDSAAYITCGAGTDYATGGPFGDCEYAYSGCPL